MDEAVQDVVEVVKKTSSTVLEKATKETFPTCSATQSET